MLAEGRHIFGRRPKPRAAKPLEKNFRAGHCKDLKETGNRARKVSGTQRGLADGRDKISLAFYKLACVAGVRKGRGRELGREARHEGGGERLQGSHSFRHPAY